nr:MULTISPECIES: DUF317 domain-containing protein [unclassified Streptomyces]
MFTSPHQNAQVAYLPASPNGGWKVTEYREPLGMPVWSASFSETTPAEITSAFTTALAHSLPSRHRDFLSGGPHYRPPSSPAGLLADRGWETDDTAQYLYQRSPDGHSSFALRKNHLDEYAELEGAAPALWTMHGGFDQVNGEHWQADFTSATPLYLVREAVLALTSTEPVQRPLCEVPERNLPYVTARSADEARDPRRSAALARTPNTPPSRPSTPAGSSPANASLSAPSRRR